MGKRKRLNGYPIPYESDQESLKVCPHCGQTFREYKRVRKFIFFVRKVCPYCEK